MPVETKQITRIDMQPEEIIRIVKVRFRICNHLFNIGGIWMGLGVILGLIFNNRFDFVIAFQIKIIGFAIFMVAFAMTLAIYRCPVCDTYLSRFRPDKLHCPCCDAKVK